MGKSSPLIADLDRFTAAALAVDRLDRRRRRRDAERRAALPEEPRWDYWTGIDGSLYSEAPDLFPGRRSAWVR